MDIAYQFQEMAIRIDVYCFKSSLKKVTRSVMPMIDPGGVTDGEILHDSGKRDIANLKSQSDMVCHAAKGVNPTLEAFYGFLKKQKKSNTIRIVKKDRFAGNGTDHDVVNGARKMYTRLTRHGERIDWNV